MGVMAWSGVNGVVLRLPGALPCGGTAEAHTACGLGGVHGRVGLDLPAQVFGGAHQPTQRRSSSTCVVVAMARRQAKGDARGASARVLAHPRRKSADHRLLRYHPRASPPAGDT